MTIMVKGMWVHPAPLFWYAVIIQKGMGLDSTQFAEGRYAVQNKPSNVHKTIHTIK